MNVTPILAAITATSTALGIAAAIGWRNALTLRDDALSELRRVKGWSDFFQEKGAQAAIELQKIKAERSRRGRHARACRADQEKALIATNLERLRSGT
jgi:hypothetical protein